MLEFLKFELAVLFRGRHTWTLLSMQDVKSRYRRSIIGPFWITLTSLVYVAGLGLVYSRLFNLELKDYLPFLSAGIIVWTFIVSLITEGSSAVINSGHIIKQIKLPLFTHVLRVVLRNFVVFLHSFIILVPLMYWYGFLTWTGVFASLLGVGVLLYAVTPMVAILAVICARYRDILPMVSSIMQLLFFITPVMWHPAQIQDLNVVIKYNFFNYLVALVRDPILNGVVPLTSILIAIVAGTVMWCIAFSVIFFNRNKIAYWL